MISKAAVLCRRVFGVVRAFMVEPVGVFTVKKFGPDYLIIVPCTSLIVILVSTLVL